jgi:hypothetical protein
MYPIYPEQVLDATTYEPNQALVGQQVQVVTRNTTTPYPIYDAAGDPISDSLVTVTAAVSTPTFYIDTDTPETVYLDWYDAGSGQRGPIDFEEVLRQTMIDGRDEIAQARQEIQDYIAANPPGSGGGVTDHGQLSGLLDDDHPQYLTEGRGDVRYYTREQAAQLIANAVSAAAPANRDRSNHTGFQSISTITNLESRLAALEAGGGGGSGILAVPVGDDLPLGIPAGSWVGRIPDDSVPPATLFEAISYDSEGTTVSCPVPSGVAVGDAVIFIPAFDPASTATNDITVSDAGWSEIFDYSANHARETAVYVYRVTDATALAALGSTVSATYASSGRRMGACFTVPGSLVDSAWPAYTSGSNRSAATINSNTTTGCSIQGFSTATVPFHKVVLFTVHDLGSDPAASDGFTVLGYATGSAGGAEARTLTVMIKDLASAPIPAATVTHSTATSSSHGGGQFVVPVAS